MNALKIIRAGLQDTIQDNGRIGYQQFGMPVAGAADSLAFQLANILIGNNPNCAAIEVTLKGPSITFLERTVIAVAGAPFPLKLNGKPIHMWGPLIVMSGDHLEFGTCRSGLRAYLALRGGVMVSKILESHSTYLRGQLGGIAGRRLQDGDIIQVYPYHGVNHAVTFNDTSVYAKRLSPYISWLAPYHKLNISQPASLRLTPTVHTELLTVDAMTHYTESSFQVTSQLDRMGVRLAEVHTTKPILTETNSSLVSDPLPIGSVQIPGDGNPIIMLTDRQPTGGYLKLGTVTAVDIPHVAQLRPGQAIRFSFISIEEGQQLLKEQARFLTTIKQTLGAFI